MNTQDTDLERRLRSIGRGAPEAPDCLDEYAREVVRQGRSRAPGGSRRRGPARLRWLGAIAATLAVLVLAGSVIRLAPTNRMGADWTPRADAGQGQWTAIEWHDVSAGFAGMYDDTYRWMVLSRSPFIEWSGGYAMVAGDLRWHFSADGLHWRLATKIPAATWLVPVKDELLVVANYPTAGVWLSPDGETLRPVAAPFDLRRLSDVVSGKPGVIVSTQVPKDENAVAPAGPATFYFSADGSTWTTATMPSDLAVARGVTVQPFMDGFLATGDVEDPNGRDSMSAEVNGVTLGPWVYSQRAWYSADGLHWSVLDAQGYVPQLSSWSWGEGALGLDSGYVHSTDGGRNWSSDQCVRDQTCPESAGPIASDGHRIILAAGGGAAFYVGEGDGNWSLLKQGGDVGHLSTDGVMVLEPRGILWISGSKVYFGEALSGIEPEGSMGAPVTPSPGPGVPATPVYAAPTAAPSTVPTTAP